MLIYKYATEILRAHHYTNAYIFTVGTCTHFALQPYRSVLLLDAYVHNIIIYYTRSREFNDIFIPSLPFDIIYIRYVYLCMYNRECYINVPTCILYAYTPTLKSRYLYKKYNYIVYYVYYIMCTQVYSCILKYLYIGTQYFNINILQTK